MRRFCLSWRALIGCALVATVLPALAIAAPFPAGATPLDSYSADNDGSAGPVAVGDPLVAGTRYRVVIRGTFSAWTKWPDRSCGRAEPAPMFPSPGPAAEPVGFDAEFRFAEPRFQRRCRTSPLPRRQSALQFDLGDGFKHYPPVDAQDLRPNRGHRYVYFVDGQGAPLQVQLVDWRTDDNSGSLAVTVAPA